VLVVEDDHATRAFLVDNLIADGFHAVGAGGAGEGLRAIEVRQPSLVVLDLGLEDGSGLTLLDRVRASDGLASRIDPDLPVIVLSGRAGDADRVRSFARGADDHVCKPFLYAELVARMRAVLRRAEGRRSRGVMRIGELTLDPATRAVRLSGRRIELAAKEFALLQALAEQPTRVYGKQELLRDVWGDRR
jgi:DNA-binding response OmpR family regulator